MLYTCTHACSQLAQSSHARLAALRAPGSCAIFLGGWGLGALPIMWAVVPFLLLLTTTLAQTTPPWLRTERKAHTWLRTTTEMEQFEQACARMPEAETWMHTRQDYAEMDQVLVLDVRHGFWVGLADSLSRVMALLRIGRSLRRTTYIWADGCADPGGPKRLLTTARANGTECFFDHGAWFATLGNIDWRWSANKRLRLASRYGDETVYAHSCLQLVEPANCNHTRLVDAAKRVVFEDHGESAVLEFLKAARMPWLRVELTSIDDLRDLARALPSDARCELYMNLRPRPRLWRMMTPYLHRLQDWDGMVVLAVRTGYADHIDMFPELHESDHSELHDLEALFTQCEGTVRPVTRFAAAGANPCVHYQTHLDTPPFTPNERAARRCGAPEEAWFAMETTPFRAYVFCAAAAAKQIAGAGRWGVLVLSDSSAVKRGVEMLLGQEHVIAVSSPRGHVQYTSDQGVAAAAAVDFYLAGLGDRVVRLSSSYFVDVSRTRSFMPHRGAGPLLEHGWPQWFEAGNERAMGRSKVSLNVMRALN